jgi:hypothetical protein
MGANVYQNRGGDRTFTQNDPDRPFFGYSLEVNPKNDVGFFGGLKLGYVFVRAGFVSRSKVTSFIMASGAGLISP